MSDTTGFEAEVGKVLGKVQNDLRQLKYSLDRLTLNAREETLDIQALDTAISRTENCIKKHSEQYLRMVNNQQQVLPCIEGLKKKKPKILEWDPVLKNNPHIQHKREEVTRVSPGHKSLTMRLLCNHTRPKSRDTMQPKFTIPLPVHKKHKHLASHQRILTGHRVGQRSIVSVNAHSNLNMARAKVDMKEGNCSILKKILPSSTLIQHMAVSIHHTESCSSQTDKTASQLTWEKEHGRADREYSSLLTDKAPTPPPSAASQSSDREHRSGIDSGNIAVSECPQNLPGPVPVPVSKFPFTIADGQIDPVAEDFCRFKQHYSWCWDSLVVALEALTRLLTESAMPLATVNGEQLASLAQRSDGGWSLASAATGPGLLLSVLQDGEEALGLVSSPGRHHRGEEGAAQAAAVQIQSCWRRYLARKAYLRRRGWAAWSAAIAWLRHAQVGCVHKALQARRFRQLENYRSRAQHLAANWKHIQSSKRTIIHIPSLGYPYYQRLSLKDLDSLQNSQISRLCDIRDENVQVIYVSPRPLDDDITRYYTSLLGPHGSSDVDESGPALSSSCSKRFTIITPDAVDHFPTHSMCLSTLLKYSPRALQRIRQLIQGREAYVVGRVAHADDLAVADELGVPVLGPEPAVAQLYATKSGGRRILAGAGVSVAPGQGDIYLLDQLHEALARLMASNVHVTRWLFKVDCEFGGRGTAYCDVCHLACHSWALQEVHRIGADLWSTQGAKEPVLLRYLDEVPEWLAHHARPAKTSHYPNWACFLKTFLRQGGVVEAYPPSESVACLTVDLLLEPGGEVTMLSCGDQLHGPCRLEALGSSVPQTSMRPDALHSVCWRVGQACLQRRVVGYVSLDLATFVDPHTSERKVWAVDLDLGYSNQLAMTQLLLCLTGGTLDCRTCDLTVPIPVKEKLSTASKPPGAFRYAVMGSRLLHTNLLMVYHSAFLKMCKAQGIGFNRMTRQGTLFVLHDSTERHSLGMITISEDLSRALVTFAQNLSVIHQEISSPKMQGETNFKDLIRGIKDVLRMTAQNKLEVAEDKKSISTT